MISQTSDIPHAMKPVRENLNHQQPATSPAAQVYHPKRHLKITVYPAVFRCHAPQANLVAVVGNFYDGQPQPMQPTGDGYWHVTLELKRGRYEYRFLVENVPILDPKSRGSILGADGTKYSLLEVGF